MADFVNSLAASFNVPGLAPRAIALFNQVRSISSFRWGNKSRSIAAACLAIALRESNRPDALRDIASMLDVPPTSVTREFTHITTSLGLSLTLIDPSAYMPTLQAHLPSLADHHRFPATLSKPLEKLNLHSVNETAVALSRLLARLSPGHDVLRLPVPPTACAVFMLALEGDLRAPLNPLGDMAEFLGARLQVAKGVVMTRYKTIQDEVASWAENVPWLDKYETRGARAKVSKRLVVARGIKDVIRFQEDIWKQRSKPALPSELAAEDNDSEHVRETEALLPCPKEGPKPNRAIVQSIQFLLDPLSTPVPALPPTSSRSSRAPFPNSQLSLATYLLTAPSASASTMLPTRLQLLACLRGGSSEDKIRDEELFAEGELENLFRDESEVRILRETFGWDKEDSVGEPHKNFNGKRKRTKTLEDITDSVDGIVTGSALRPRKTRLNMEALAQFISQDHGALVDSEPLMGLEEAIDEVDLESVDQRSGEHKDDKRDEEETAQPFPKRRRQSNCRLASNSVNDAEGIILDEWRPPSPGSGVTYNDSRYEEEYD
jgi:transcription factor IIIB subunit 2